MQTSDTSLVAKRSFRHLWAPILGIGLTQMIGWGTSFTAITILGTSIGRDLQMAREAVFGGVTVMMIVSGLLAPRFGRRIDAQGARGLMVPGALVGAVALLVIGVARGPISFWFGWGLFGLSVAMMMTNAAVPALVQIAGADARRAVTIYTVITGVTSAVFLPLTSWIESQVGWRGTFLAFSLMFLCVCLPIHMAVLPTERPLRQRSSDAKSDVSWDGLLPERQRRLGFWLITAWMALQAIIVWGFNLQVIDILQDAGIGHAAAISLWMLAGPSQAAARLGDLLSGGRYGVMTLALTGAALAPIGFAIAFMAGVSNWTMAVLAIGFGIGQGLYAVARSMVPLRLFGMKTYGETIGLLSLPLNIACAAAPLLFSLLVARAGATAAMWVAGVAGLLSFVAVLVLGRIASRAATVADAE